MTSTQYSHDLGVLSPAAREWLERKPACYIDGEWISVSQTIPVLDPSSGRPVSEIAAAGEDHVDMAVEAAQRAMHPSSDWRRMGPLSREKALHRLAALIEENIGSLSQVETVDNGMPHWFAIGSIHGVADIFRYYAGWPTKIAGQTLVTEGPPNSGDCRGHTLLSPVGVVAAITPWNVPLMMAAWKLAPALAAGCAVVLKPAEDTSLTALMLAALCEQAGLPKGVVNIVTGVGAEAGEALINHSGVSKISFTGSTRVGRHIGEVAGRNVKKHTLELGGKSPTLLFNDADLDEAVPGAATALFLNSGQICVAGSRLYVQSGIYQEVMERLQEHINGIKVGAGFAPDVFMGPLVNAAQKRRVQGYIESAESAGYDVLRGQAVDESQGYYVAPTVIAGASDNANVTCEEIFGPVLSVYKFDDEDEALKRANEGEYGLAARLWTRDVSRALRISEALECGKVMINNPGYPYPALPEGGVKGSGHGKDLGKDALDACLHKKTVLIKL